MAGNRPLRRWITAAVAGVLAGLALPPWGCPPLLWCALVPLWALGPGPALVWGGAAVLVSHRWLLWLHPLDLDFNEVLARIKTKKYENLL